MGLSLLLIELWIAKRSYSGSGLNGWREFCGDVLTVPAGPCTGQLVTIRGILLLTAGVIAWSCFRESAQIPSVTALRPSPPLR